MEALFIFTLAVIALVITNYFSKHNGYLKAHYQALYPGTWVEFLDDMTVTKMGFSTHFKKGTLAIVTGGGISLWIAWPLNDLERRDHQGIYDIAKLKILNPAHVDKKIFEEATKSLWEYQHRD